MRSVRPSWIAALLTVAVLLGGAAFAINWRGDPFAGDPAIDCVSYVFPTARWRSELRSRSPDEALTRQLARNVVRCELIIGRSPGDVRALLGRPDHAQIDDNPRPHRDWSYDVGLASNILDVKEVHLHMEFDRGRIAYVGAPGRTPGRRYDEVTAGAPVGGGAIPTPP